MELEGLIIKDAEFERRMNGEVLPFINENIQDGYFSTSRNARLHYQYLINENEKGTIVMSHGYCEFITKYYEIMYYFYMFGYSVFMVEHRGYGYSSRQVKGYSKVHVDHFYDYVSDFDDFVDKIKCDHKSNHYYLFAHSMGGAVAALYLENYPGTFEKAILSSPMFEMNLGDTSSFIKKVICLSSYIPGINKMYVPGQKDYDHEYKYPRCSSISEARYKYQYDQREKDEHYRSNGASTAWCREAINVSKIILKNANLVKIPVILFQASLDHLVMPEPQNEFARSSANTMLLRIEDSKHEVFNATDDIILNYYKKIIEFLN